MRSRRLMITASALCPALVLCAGCIKTEPITSPFVDTFDRVEVGSNYRNTGAPFRIENSSLAIQGAHNHPLWLRKMLPQNAEIEVDVTSRSPDGDIKVEAWGDGESYDPDGDSYLATSYVFILGGWGNSISALCRMDEHAPDRKTRSDFRVEPNRTYHLKIRRKGALVEWFVDGKPFLSWNDSTPLAGAKHAYFAFNNWETDVRYDNLKITPL